MTKFSPRPHPEIEYCLDTSVYFVFLPFAIKKIFIDIEADRSLGSIFSSSFKCESAPFLLFFSCLYLWQDLVAHNGLRELVRVVGKAAQRDSSRVLNCRHCVQQQRPQMRHHTSIVQGLNVLRPLCCFRDGLHKLESALLVLIKDLLRIKEQTLRRVTQLR